MTAEQLEAARAERMRQNGHAAIVLDDVRTWIEETGLCIFVPRSAQAGQSILGTPSATPTFVEAVAGQRITEPTLELIAESEALLVRLETEGVAVRLNLAGQPGDQPDYVVAGWVLPYIYALRGDRDWRRPPQLTGSRQVSPLAVQAAKQLETANLNAIQIRDALGREVTETAVLRALHELWKQLRIIPVVSEVGTPALWQPLRQRFQKAIAEGASTSQVTAISVLASIYLQAVIAASMEDIEIFLAPLTSRSKIREVVRGLAATRQVHTTNLGHSSMYYVAGTLPDFPVVPSYQAPTGFSSYRSSSYIDSYLGNLHEDRHDEDLHSLGRNGNATTTPAQPAAEPVAEPAPRPTAPVHSTKPAASGKHVSPAKSPAPRPRAGSERHRPHAPRSSSAGNGRTSAGSSRSSARPAASHGNGNGSGNGSHHGKPARPAANGHWAARPAANGNGSKSAPARPGARTDNRPGARKTNAPAVSSRSASAYKSTAKPGARPANGTRSTSSRNGSATAHSTARPANANRTTDSRKPTASASKRYSFAGQAKQAPKSGAKANGRVSRPVAKSAAGSKSHGKPAASKRRG